MSRAGRRRRTGGRAPGVHGPGTPAGTSGDEAGSDGGDGGDGSASGDGSGPVARFRIDWTLAGPGWADCVVTAGDATVELTASYIGHAPEELLTAVARITAADADGDGETEARAQFEAEPTAYRWIFRRHGGTVRLRLLELRHGTEPDRAGTELWSGTLSVDALARATVRCFDEVARVYGASGYRGEWREHFPSSELEALRRTWRARR